MDAAAIAQLLCTLPTGNEDEPHRPLSSLAAPDVEHDHNLDDETHSAHFEWRQLEASQPKFHELAAVRCVADALEGMVVATDSDLQV